MMRALVVALALLTLFVSSVASDKPSAPLRPVHTFSIVARDPATGELGVARAVTLVLSWFNRRVG